MSTTGLKLSLFAAVMLSCVHKEPTAVAQDPAVPVEYATTLGCLPDWPCEKALWAVIVQTKVNFDSNRTTLTPMSQVGLQAVAHLLRKYPATRIVIAGNCDERGTDEYNLRLGHKRAEIAKKYLVVLGVDPAQMVTISYGFHDRSMSGTAQGAGWTDTTTISVRRSDREGVKSVPTN